MTSLNVESSSHFNWFCLTTFCACAQPKCFDTHFHPARKHKSVPVSLSVVTIEKVDEKRAGFCLSPVFSIVLTDREPGTSYKNVNAILMVTSVKEFRDTATSKSNSRWITLGNNMLIGSVITLDSLLCTVRIGQ